MLYDILIIDDDFSGETVLGELISNATQGNHTSWHDTIMPLYFDLTRENLRVIWSTGELDDLEKLDKSQLSNVRYIICDLHLLGIDINAINKTIVSKIMGILDGLKDTLGDNVISFLINSKYIEDHSGIEDDLQTKLNKSYPNKYTITAFSKKNAIADEQKQELLDRSLLNHIKEQILKKHLELERHFNEKIDVEDANLKDEVLRELSFNSKHKIVKKIFIIDGSGGKIDKFNESRNYIAHHEIDSLADLKGVKNIEGNSVKTFNNFSDLTDYLEKIDPLIALIKDAPKK